MDGNISRNARGLTTAPDRLWSPNPPAFSSTPISTSPAPSPVSFPSATSRASSIAPARPAGPAPTNTTSNGTASAPGGSRTISFSTGSAGWCRPG